MEKRIYYLSNTVIPNTKREKNIHVFNVFTQVGVKQLTDFLRTVTVASDLVECTLVNCDNTKIKKRQKIPTIPTVVVYFLLRTYPPFSWLFCKIIVETVNDDTDQKVVSVLVT